MLILMHLLILNHLTKLILGADADSEEDVDSDSELFVTIEVDSESESETEIGFWSYWLRCTLLPWCMLWTLMHDSYGTEADA